MNPLVVPPAAQRDENAVQMLSAWIAERGLHCSLKVGFWQAQGRDEARSWGILLADVIRHVGNAMEEQQGVHSSAAVQSILEALNAELDQPTSPAKGQFHPGHS
ncbi:DUF5076 domain-containing protein [Variovorax sp. CCNWLW186]|jgi:hypothetical protein|uniref:DUF5076 domain-containing protein n=1 Tax=Variovorax sp. CCNWLW186 TaxID=3127473 RepID=UPI0030780B7B